MTHVAQAPNPTPTSNPKTGNDHSRLGTLNMRVENLNYANSADQAQAPTQSQRPDEIRAQTYEERLTTAVGRMVSERENVRNENQGVRHDALKNLTDVVNKNPEAFLYQEPTEKSDAKLQLIKPQIAQALGLKNTALEVYAEGGDVNLNGFAIKEAKTGALLVFFEVPWDRTQTKTQVKRQELYTGNLMVHAPNLKAAGSALCANDACSNILGSTDQ